MTAFGRWASIPRTAAARAARAATKSVSANVRTRRDGAALTISTLAPARAIAAVSSAAAVRQPSVLPAETTSTSVLDMCAQARGLARRLCPDAPFSSIRFVRKPGVRTSWIGFSGEVRTT